MVEQGTVRKIQAVSVGRWVPGEFSGAAVHSVFHTAANLAVEGLDYLLTLFISSSTDLPQGIRIPPDGEPLFKGLAQGQMVHCAAGIIRDARHTFEISTSDARPYASHLAQLGCDHLSGAYILAWQVARDALDRRQAEKQAGLRFADVEQAKLGSSQAGGVAQYLRVLTQAARLMDLAQARESVQALVGLGGGLTPTGDDVLVGFLAGLWASRGPEQPRTAWINALGEQVRTASRKTNDISRSYLWLATEGQFSSSLTGLAAAICAGQPAGVVHAAAEIVFQTGHTSGLDAATGLLAGLTAWAGSPFMN